MKIATTNSKTGVKSYLGYLTVFTLPKDIMSTVAKILNFKRKQGEWQGRMSTVPKEYYPDVKNLTLILNFRRI